MNIQPRLQTVTCPCCGGFLGEAAPLDAVREKVRMGHQLIILDKLSRRVGRLVSSDDLIDAMYASHADGGPDKANGVLSVSMSRLKQEIAAFGWTIISVGRGSGNRASYKLIPISTSATDLYREVKVKRGAK